jgi:hypothetical protein
MVVPAGGMLGPSEGICENSPKMIRAATNIRARNISTENTNKVGTKPSITVIVLVSALMHAAWNAVIKGGEDALVTQAAVVVGGAFFFVPFRIRKLGFTWR